MDLHSIRDNEHHTAFAKELLLNNNRGGYTIPSARLYPFQWNWDSGFIALGLLHIDLQKAMEEIRSLFKGQWSNGMLPHINFHHPDPNYFPGPDHWATNDIPERPSAVQTSGITQPPVIGFILARMNDFLVEKPAEWKTFLKEIFPKVVDSHRYLYENRDPHREGLVYIHHNWESGTDNSPVWDDILEGIDVSQARDVATLRRDIKNVDVAQRPTNENYKRYICLIDLFIKHRYKDAEIVKECPFLVQDILFNCMLVKSNQGLIELAEKLNFDASILVEWNNKTIKAIQQKLWDESCGFYYNYDLKNQRRIPIKISSGFMPLFAGICTKQQADQLVYHLQYSFVKNEEWMLCPSTAADEPAFNPLKYWRGPVWINLNWMLYHGLLRYEKTDLAHKIKEQSVQLMQTIGMFEYFDARPVSEGGTRAGLGADLFSWSAALYLDFLYDPKPF